jgi:hypothetical protein
MTAHDSNAPNPLPPLPEGVAPLASVEIHDESERVDLEELARRAEEYIGSFRWCASVRQQYFAGGIGFVFAIYLFDVVPARPNIPNRVWVFVGDVPLAYLSIEDAATPLEAFNKYVAGMRRWVEVARVSGSIDGRADLPPVNVPPTPEWAEELGGRLDFLDANFRELFEPGTKV